MKNKINKIMNSNQFTPLNNVEFNKHYYLIIKRLFRKTYLLQVSVKALTKSKTRIYLFT